MPTVDMNLCMKCFACVGACPNNAISDTPKGPKFDSKKCMKCGSCAEMCPAGAIKI